MKFPRVFRRDDDYVILFGPATMFDGTKKGFGKGEMVCPGIHIWGHEGEMTGSVTFYVNLEQRGWEQVYP